MASGRIDEYVALVTRALRLLGFTMLPVACIAAGVALQVVDLVIDFGRVEEAGIALTGAAFLGLLAALPTEAMIIVLSRAFFAARNTWIPVGAALVAVGVAIVAALALVEPLGIVGLSLGLVAASWAEALLLLAAFRRRHDDFGLVRLARAHAWYLAAAVAAGLVADRAYDVLATGLGRDPGPARGGGRPGRRRPCRAGRVRGARRRCCAFPSSGSRSTWSGRGSPGGGHDRARARRSVRGARRPAAGRRPAAPDDGRGLARGAGGRSGRDAAARDVGGWDAFVESTAHGSYLQLAGWARVKKPNGWTARRILAGDPGARIGMQLLLRRPRPLPWAFAYAPRGPVAEAWTGPAIAELTAAVRSARPALGRVSHVRIDPEVEVDGPDDADGALRAGLVAAGWRPAPSVQPPTSRVIDLAADEEALWSDLRKKWRQYVNKARSNGVTVVELPGDPIAPFYAIYRETAERAGFLIRVEQAYRDVWDAFAPAGRARILFAVGPAGEPLASLFLVRCGRRVVEPYGGMTEVGAELRANYLLKWEAIRRARAEGAEAYDLWGLAHPGIAHFKAGFGGREVRYVGGWDLVLDPLGRRVYETAQAARVRWARSRAGLGPGAVPAPTAGAGAGTAEDG